MSSQSDWGDGQSDHYKHSLARARPGRCTRDQRERIYNMSDWEEERFQEDFLEEAVPVWNSEAKTRLGKGEKGTGEQHNGTKVGKAWLHTAWCCWCSNNPSVKLFTVSSLTLTVLTSLYTNIHCRIYHILSNTWTHMPWPSFVFVSQTHSVTRIGILRTQRLHETGWFSGAGTLKSSIVDSQRNWEKKFLLLRSTCSYSIPFEYCVKSWKF